MNGYISDMEKYIKNRTEIAVTACSLAALFLFPSCAYMESEGFKAKVRKGWEQGNNSSSIVNVYHYGIPRGRRVGLDADSINANTQDMLHKMEN